MEKEIARLNEEFTGLKAQWEAEKAVIQAIQALKQKLEKAKIGAGRRRARQADFNKAAEIKFGMIPSLEARADGQKDARPAEIQSRVGAMLKEEVTAEDIAEVVSKWTGIPVSKLMEAEMQKLLKMEERLGQRVVGQEEAIGAVSNAVRRARAGLQDPNRPIGSLHLPRAHRRGQDGDGPGAGRVPVRRRATPWSAST